MGLYPGIGKLLSVPVLLVAAAAVSSGPEVGTAPPSASTPVEASVAGLAMLFDRECIQQINRAWVERRSRDILGTCAIDNGDCTTELDGELNWKVPSTDRSDVFVSMAWNQKFVGETPSSGPPAGQLRCSLYVMDGKGAALKDVAARLKPGGKSLAGSSADTNPGIYVDTIWRTENGDQIILRHHVRKYPEKDEPNFRPYAHSFVDDMKYTWELIYVPGKR